MPSNELLRLESVSCDVEISHESGKFLWSNILKEVTSKTAFKLPDTRTLVVLGDEESGKTTLIARLQGTEDPKKSFGLEYTFIDVKDEDRDDQTKMNVWILDEGISQNRLLKFALNANNLGECIVVIVVSMSEPWNIMTSLKHWTELLEVHMKGLPVSQDILDEYKSGLVRQFKDYTEPDLLLPPSTPTAVAHAPLPTAPVNPRRFPSHNLHPAMAAMLSSTLSVSMPKSEAEPVQSEPSETTDVLLDKTTLSQNLGVPIVVVVTKTDTMNTLEKEERYTEEHFDFIQMHIRQFCLKYGAALFYLSVKEDKHCDLLNRYLQSRMYGFPFTQAPYVVERDCVFIPAGWDSEKKIAILKENFTQVRAEDSYDTVIRQPPPRKTAVNEPELVAQEEQSFLTRLMTLLQRDISTPNSADNVMDHPGAQVAGSPLIAQRQTTGSPRTPPTSLRSKPSPPGPNPNSGPSNITPNSRASEGVLANFFTSLLNRHSNVGTAAASTTVSGAPVQSPTPGQGSDKLSMSPKDILSELERLARSSRETLEANKTVRPRTSLTSQEGETLTTAESEQPEDPVVEEKS